LFKSYTRQVKSNYQCERVRQRLAVHTRHMCSHHTHLMHAAVLGTPPGSEYFLFPAVSCPPGDVFTFSLRCHPQSEF